MKAEVDAAVGWWTLQLSKKIDHKGLLDNFTNTMTRHVYRKFAKHWYPTERLRGSSFRCISFDRKLDPLILDTADEMGMMDANKLFAHCKHTIMFVNPGEVKMSSSVRANAEPTSIWKGTTDPNFSYEYAQPGR